MKLTYSFVKFANQCNKRLILRRKNFDIVLRGDSTLRGYFPSELHAVEDIIGKTDLWILAPCFSQGHRVTIDDVHIIADVHSDTLVPAAHTPFCGRRNLLLQKFKPRKLRGGKVIWPHRKKCYILGLLTESASLGCVRSDTNVTKYATWLGCYRQCSSS